VSSSLWNLWPDVILCLKVAVLSLLSALFDERSVSMSWCQVHSRTCDQMLFCVWKLLCCLGGAPSLTRGQSVCLGVKFTLELVTRCYFVSESCCVVSVERPLWREVSQYVLVLSSLRKLRGSELVQGSSCSVRYFRVAHKLFPATPRGTHTPGWRPLVLSIHVRRNVVYLFSVIYPCRKLNRKPLDKIELNTVSQK
jgi:hypothetical protein